MQVYEDTWILAIPGLKQSKYRIERAYNEPINEIELLKDSYETYEHKIF